ncbi:N-acetyltransferase [Streptomyces armeniacus]|uniref:N-acetyltransferase n=1 Tax=Streptomyces armeniacus TaxID=83291 RepID=A0A345XQC5_9ACTN|nr:GNAT family protein [Streptomyces armeniacus]AXK33841.1 N-acetyltransferase [Streptomyces armeniacus]
MFALPLTDTAELRPLEPWQAEEFAESIDSARAHLSPWLPWPALITDVGSARRWLRDYADKQARDEGRIYGIWADGRLVGGLVFRTFDVASGVCEIGAWTVPEGEGRGLVHRGARELIDWAFRVRGMSRVEWRTVTANVRSTAAARRLGMTRDGTLRQVHAQDGRRHDVEVWSLLADEWTAAAAQERGAA